MKQSSIKSVTHCHPILAINSSTSIIRQHIPVADVNTIKEQQDVERGYVQFFHFQVLKDTFVQCCQGRILINVPTWSHNPSKYHASSHVSKNSSTPIIVHHTPLEDVNSSEQQQDGADTYNSFTVKFWKAPEESISNFSLSWMRLHEPNIVQNITHHSILATMRQLP